MSQASPERLTSSQATPWSCLATLVYTLTDRRLAALRAADARAWSTAWSILGHGTWFIRALNGAAMIRQGNGPRGGDLLRALKNKGGLVRLHVTKMGLPRLELLRLGNTRCAGSNWPVLFPAEKSPGVLSALPPFPLLYRITVHITVSPYHRMHLTHGYCKDPRQHQQTR